MKRLLSMVLALVMILSLLPAQALAEGIQSLTQTLSESTDPVETEPVIQETEPEPAEPAPTEPIPTEPTPTEPAPTEPIPTEPAPTEPIPTEPMPTAPVQDDDAQVDSGDCGELITWKLEEDGTLQIQGSGIMTSYTAASSVPWYSQRDSILTIRVSEGITEIGSYAFANCRKVTTLQLPETLEVIGDNAFYGCRELTAVTIPSGVSAVGVEAFYNCEKLESITLPEGITELKAGVFRGCIALTQVKLPSALTSIGKEAFCSCQVLTEIKIPDSVQSIGYRAFANCRKLASVTLPSGWVDCPSYREGSTGSSYQGNLFYGCSALTTIAIPAGITELPAYAFMDATGLQSVQFPAGLTGIGDYAFSNCTALKSMVVPEGITQLQTGTFSGCSALEQIQLPETLRSIGKDAFFGCKALLKLTIPNGVESLGYRAFSNCTNLAEISLPTGWVDCPSYREGSTGSSYQGNLFYGCKALTQIIVPEGVAALPEYTFYDANYVQSIQLPKSLTTLPDKAFSGCSELESVVFQGSVTTLPERTFYYCSALTSVQMPSTLTTIGKEAFRNCTALQEIVIPNGVTLVDEGAFNGCTALTNVQLPTTLQAVSEGTFNGCKALQSIVIPEGVTVLKLRAFYGCSALTEVQLPQTLKTVDKEAFANCTALTSMVFPNGVERLGYRLFDNCTNLVHVVLPSGWKECHSYQEGSSGSSYQGRLFTGCSNLTTVVLPEGMVSLPKYAFYDCQYIQRISLPATLRELSDSAFENCKALENIEIPNGVTVIPAYAFRNCTGLQWVKLPNSLTQIKRNAFVDCDSLKNLTIPNSVSGLGFRAFANCDNLSSVMLPTSWSECPSYHSSAAGESYQGQLFYSCEALTYLAIPEGVTVLPDYAFYNCDGLQSIVLPVSMTSIGKDACYGCDSLENVTMSSGITTIGQSAFSGCSALRQVAFPQNLKLVDSQAFANCQNLEEAVFQPGLEEIGGYAFNRCTGLKKVVIPDSALKIGSHAFYGCKALEEITLSDTVEIGTAAFDSITTQGELNNISWEFDMKSRTLTIKGKGDMVLQRDDANNPTIPWQHLRSLTRVLVLEPGIMSIDADAFREFRNITILDVPDTVFGVGAYCFADCTKLQRVILGENIRIVGESAFAGCNDLRQLIIISTADNFTLGKNAIPNMASLTVTYPETEKAYGEHIRKNYPNVKLSTWDNTLPTRDVVLVLDVSGSMEGDRIESLREAAKLFLDRVGGVATNSRVAIVSYNDNAKTISRFSWDADYLKAAVDNLSAAGGTQYGNALTAADGILAESDEDVRAMIFFTDGQPNDNTTTILSMCDQLRKEYRIYTVGFQPSASGQELLQKMAGNPKNYYTSSDMESLAEAFKALSGRVGSEVEDEDYYNLTVERQFVIKTSKNRFPSDIGFQIQVRDKTFRSGLAADALVAEEIIVAEIPEDYTGDVIVSREGYITYKMPAAMAGNNNVVIMYPENQKEPFPQSLLYQPVADRQSFRNCFENVSIAENALTGDENRKTCFYVDIQWQGYTPGKVWLSQGENKLELKDKQLCEIPFGKTFKNGAGDVYLHFQSPDGYAGSLKTAIYVAAADNRIPLDISGSMEISQEDMEKVKILGANKFSVDLSSVADLPLSFAVESDGTVSGTIGLKKDGEKLGAETKGKGDTLREAFANLGKGGDEDEIAAILDKLTQMGEPQVGEFGVEGKVWVMGYFSGKLSEDGRLEFKELKTYIIAQGGISYTLPFTVMGVPLYFQAQLAAQIQGAIYLKHENQKLLPDVGAKVEVSMTISVGAGVGVEGLLTGGIQGDGTAGMEIPLSDPKDLNAYVEAKLLVVGSVLGIKGEWEVWASDKYYFYKDRKFTWTKEMEAAVESGRFKLIPEPAHNSKFYATGLEKTTAKMAYQILKSDTTKFTEPSLITYDDGTKLVVWVDVVPGRTGINAYGVYYSYYNGSSWSSPKLVADDGTNDYGPSLVEVGGDVYVLWHDYDKVFSQDASEVNTAAEHINISIARFDRASGSMKAGYEFSAGGYDHQPQLRKTDGQLQLAWKCGVDTAETMYVAVSKGADAWGAPVQSTVSWYKETEQGVPSDYKGKSLGNIGAVENVEADGIRAIVYRAKDLSGNQNVFVVYRNDSGWGEPIQVTFFSDGTYVDNFSAEIHNNRLQLILNVVGSKSNLVYMEQSLGTDLAVLYADYDHFTLVPGKNAVFYARVTNRGAQTEDMMKLRVLDGKGNVLKTQLSEVTLDSGETAILEMNCPVPADNSLQNVTLTVLPVHGSDVNESNNSRSFTITYKDISVEEIRAFASETATSVTARVVNRGNETLGAVNYVLHYRTPEGEQVAAGKVPSLEAGKVATLYMELPALEVGELLYLQVEQLENENLISNNLGRACIQSVYSDEVTVTSVMLDREYVAMQKGQSLKLQATCEPGAARSKLMWRAENQSGENVITVTQDGTVTACGVGTAYAVAYVQTGSTEMAARCRVDVTEGTVSQQITGLQLSTTAVTSNLYSREYASFDVVLKLAQNSAAEAGKPQHEGVAITAARFADEAMATVFNLVCDDDRTVRIVPKDSAVANAKTVKSNYTGKVIITVDGREFTTENLKVTVKKTLPKLKMSPISFNSFYPGKTQTLALTNATVTKVRADDSKSSPVPEWLTLEDGALKLRNNADTASRSGKLYLEVETEEWVVPLKVSTKVSAKYVAPSVKLASSKVTFAALDSAGVQLTLRCGSKKDTLADLQVTGVVAPSGFAVEEFNLNTGTFLLKPTKQVTAGKYTLQVTFGNTEKTLSLPITVKTQSVKLKLQKSTVSVNPQVGDSVLVPLTITPADYQLSMLRWSVKDSSKNEAGSALNVALQPEGLLISTNEQTVSGTAYKLYVSVPGSNEAVLTVKTLKEATKAPTMSLKSAKEVDLLYPESEAVVTAQFKNCSGDANLKYQWRVDAYKGKTKQADVTDKFQIRQDGRQYYISRKAGAELRTDLTYKLTLTVELPNGQTCAATANIRVKQTALKVKLTGKLDTTLKDSVVTVTGPYSGYTGDAKPVQQLQIFTAQDGKNFDVDVTSLFQIQQMPDGSFAVSKAPGAQIDHTRKYSVKLTLQFADGMRMVSGLSSMSVKAGKISVTAAPSQLTLYRADRYSRAAFCLNTKNEENYPIAKVSFKDPRLDAIYEIYDYGNGEFAIGFRNGRIGDGVKSQKITLNVFLEGNGSGKPNGTVTLKLTVK